MQSFGIKIERIDRDLLWVYVTDRFGGYIYKEAQSEPKETSISGSRLYYGVHLHNATNNTREVEGGPKNFDERARRAGRCPRRGRGAPVRAPGKS